MNSKVAATPMVDKVNMVSGTSPSRTSSSKKNPVKVPKKIHKAEREKIKREHLNELFLALGNALELAEPNSGRASVLTEAIRIVKDTLSQIESLRKENTDLLSESRYVSTETKELLDENTTLETQIRQLKTELKARVSPSLSKLDLNLAPSECFVDQDHVTHLATGQVLQQGQIGNSVYVIPMQTQPEPVSVVSKPHPRYPTSDDTWPFRLLEK